MQRNTYVRLSWALDPASGETYRISDSFVQRGKASGLVCGDCGMPMVAKKGEERAWHFAHPSSGQAGEGCRHWDAVWELYHRIQGAMQREEGVSFRWHCKDCRREHTGDLAQGATSVYRETLVPTKEVKPDISLYRKDAPYRFIEVVDTNPPKEHVRKYAREKDVSLVVVQLRDNTDLHGTIKAKVLEGSDCPTPPNGAALLGPLPAKETPKTEVELFEMVVSTKEGCRTTVIAPPDRLSCPYCNKDMTGGYRRFLWHLCEVRRQIVLRTLLRVMPQTA